MDSRAKSLTVLAAAGVGASMATRAAFRRFREADLRGKTVVVMGGSRGLGFALAAAFLSEGARVAIGARDPEELERARERLAARGPVMVHPCDVTDRPQIDRFLDAVRDRWGAVHVLVNNAGVIHVGPFEHMTTEDFEESLQVHFWGPLHAILAVLPEMRERREGRIVNISSIGGRMAAPHLLPYTAGKFALAGLSEGLRIELLKDGVTVTTIFPGLMRTGGYRNARFKGRHREEHAWLSIGNSAPLLTIDAATAARQIVTACKRGEAEAILSLPAKLAILLRHGFPGLTTGAMSLANALLPEPGGIGEQSVEGRESRSAVSPSPLTVLSDRAAERYNQE